MAMATVDETRVSVDELVRRAKAALSPDINDTEAAYDFAEEAFQRSPNNQQVQYVWAQAQMLRDYNREAMAILALLSRDNFLWSRLRYGWCQVIVGLQDEDEQLIEIGLKTIISGFQKATTMGGPNGGPDPETHICHLEALEFHDVEIGRAHV